MMGTMKSTIVPEESRSAIYNIYRVPLNIVVIATLAVKLDLHFAFTLNAILLGIAVFFQLRLMNSAHVLAQSAQYDHAADAEDDIEDNALDDDASVERMTSHEGPAGSSSKKSPTSNTGKSPTNSIA